MAEKQLKGVVIRVRDLAEAERRYSKMLGVEPTKLPDHYFAAPGQVSGIRFDLGESYIQFVAGIGDESPLSKLTEKLGEGLSQIALWVDDVDVEITAFESEGVQFGEGEPRDLPLGRVAFGHPKTLNGVVWELEEHATRSQE